MTWLEVYLLICGGIAVAMIGMKRAEIGNETKVWVHVSAGVLLVPFLAISLPILLLMEMVDRAYWAWWEVTR